CARRVFFYYFDYW
nr:immunoglobulin heavy chain junction region [Mus musculus]